jgi:hypothetical protein
MDYTRFFRGAKITNPRGARELRGRFVMLAGEDHISRERYEITAGDEQVEYESVEDFCASPMLPRADGFWIRMAGGDKFLWVRCSPSGFEEGARVSVHVDGFDEGTAVGLVSQAKSCLGVEPGRARPVAKWRGVARSAFLGYAFDTPGQEVAAFVRELLELLDFTVVSGEPFAATGVSDKIRDRIRQQGIAVCVFTEREAPTDREPRYSDWVRDEATFAAAVGKPLFVLVEESVGQIPGIHGDLEYIPFRRGHLARPGLKLLEGLKGAGFALSPKPPRGQAGMGVMRLVGLLLGRGSRGVQDAG